MLDPNQATMVPNLVARDLKQPPGRVLSVELRKPPVSDDEHLLHHVVAVGLRHPQGLHPASNVAAPSVVQRIEQRASLR